MAVVGIYCFYLLIDFIMSDKVIFQPKTIIGTVRTGHNQGSRVGARTANLDLSLAKDLIKGLYAGEVLWSGKIFQGLLYYGINSLTNEDCLEVHVLDFEGDLYGQTIAFSTRQYLRPPQYFNSAAKLAEQIKKDLATAKLF